MISAKNINFSIHKRKLLNSISLDIVPGLFTAIAGPNGAGKTSLLKVLSQEITHQEGTIEINGAPARQYSVADLSRIRAVLPQSSHMQFPFSVKEVIEMGRHYQTASQHVKVLHEVMELTGIADWGHRNYLTLSGGEQQRVQLARVLAQVWEVKAYPRYILLDEPTSSLDIAQQQLIFGLVKQACERNIGVLAIVHDLNQVAQFADKLYFLKEGSIVAQGKIDEVFTKHIIEETFCCRVNVYRDPCTNCPYIVPDRNTYSSSSFKTVNL
jgi:iron complex transport system ATP-binding protein